MKTCCLCRNFGCSNHFIDWLRGVVTV